MFPGEHKVELGRPAIEFRRIFFGLAISEEIGIFTVSLVLHFLTRKFILLLTVGKWSSLQ